MMKIEVPDAPDCDKNGHGTMYLAYEVAGTTETKSVFRCHSCNAEKSRVIEREK